MKFCRKCGAEIQENKSFCTKCGTQLYVELKELEDISDKEELKVKEVICDKKEISTNENISDNEVINTKESTSYKEEIKIEEKSKDQNNNFKKKQRILLIVVGLILAMGIIGLSYEASLTSKKSIISKFTQAIKTKNSEQLAKYLTSSDTKLKIETNKLDNLLKYLEANPSYRDEVIKSIEEQSLQVDSKLSEKSDSNTNNLFTLKKQGKTAMFFDNYVFEIRPAYIKVSTNFSGTEIYFENELIYTTEGQDATKEIGPYIPGVYNMKAVLKGEYVNLEKSTEVNLISSYSNSTDVSLYLDGYTPAIDCDYQDAEIFANGKDTGIQVKDAKKFGPVSKEGSVKLYAQREFPWGVVKGEEVAINGESTVKLNLSGVNEQVQEKLMTTLNTINLNWCVAERLRDPSKLINFTEKMKEKFTKDIQELIEDKQLYTGELEKVVFDLDSMKIYMKDNKYYAEFKDKETYNSVYYKEGTMPKKSLGDVIWTYTMVYDNSSKQWLQDNVEKGYSFSPTKKKEFTF